MSPPLEPPHSTPARAGWGGQPLYVQSLDLSALPTGREVRVMVELVRNSLGAPIRVPVVVIRGKKEGPVFGLVAALHGNELNGIPVLHDLIDRLDPHQLRGTIVAVLVANVPGYLKRQREFNEGTDLNHIMPGKEPGTEAQIYAHRLVTRIVRHFDYMIDLHTASFGRVNSLYIRADMTSHFTARMAYLQRPQIILHNPASDKTLRGTAMGLGIPAITVEIGNPHQFQPEYIRRSLVGIRAVLGEFGLVSRRKKLAAGAEPVICQSSSWLYTQEGGLLEVYPSVTDTVAAGDVIATVRDIFGDVLQEYQAPHDGVIIGKSVEPVTQTGARIVHLGHLSEGPELEAYYRRDVTNSLATPSSSVAESEEEL